MPRYQDIIWVRPTGGSTQVQGPFDLIAQLRLAPNRLANDPLTLEANLRRPDGGAARLALLPTFGGFFRSGFVLDSIGPWSAVASWPDSGVPAATIGFSVGAAPPQFRVTLPPPPARAVEAGLSTVDPLSMGAIWKRDDVISLQVTLDDGGVVPSSVVVSLVGTRSDGTADSRDLPLDAGCEVPCPDAGFCVCARADLSVPDFAMMRGEMTLLVRGDSLSGQSVTTTSADDMVRLPPLGVTRLAWQRTLLSAPATGNTSIQPIVIDRRGRAVVFAKCLALNESVISSIKPDGTRQWAVPANLEGPPVLVERPDGGTALLLPEFFSGFGFIDPDTGARIPAGLPFPAKTGVLASLMPAGATDAGVAAILAAGHELNLSGFTAAAWTESSLQYGSLAQASYSHGFAGGGNRLAWFGSRVGWPDSIDVYEFNGSQLIHSRNFSYAFPMRQMAWVGNSFVGGDTVFVGGPGFVRFGPQSATPDWAFPGSSYGSRGFAIGAPQVLFGIQNDAQMRPALIRIRLGAGAPSHFAPQTPAVFVAPALAAGGVVSTVNVAGGLQLWNAANLTPRWPGGAALLASSATFTGGNYAHAPSAPALDCARDPQGARQAGRPGRLLVASDQAILHSVIVDERGVDTQAPWPLIHRDPENSANSASDLTRFQCP